jgi:hypothetical protein
VNVESLISSLKAFEDSETYRVASPHDAALFRAVEAELEDWLVGAEVSDRFAEAFSVYLLLEHVLTVLTGDVRYFKESDRLAGEVFGALGRLLGELSRWLRDDNPDKKNFDGVFREAVLTYLQNVRRIGPLIETKEASG